MVSNGIVLTNTVRSIRLITLRSAVDLRSCLLDVRNKSNANISVERDQHLMAAYVLEADDIERNSGKFDIVSAVAKGLLFTGQASGRCHRRQ